MARLDTVLLLRATAALLVALGHLQADAALLPGGATMPKLPLDFGVLALRIDLLFAISGFVLVHSTRDAFETPGAGRIMLAKRLVRIVPLYWLMTLLLAAALLAAPSLLKSTGPVPGEVLRSLLFIPYQSDAASLSQPLYKVGWTLNYEIMFYVIFASTLWLERRIAIIATVGILTFMVSLGANVALPQPFAFWCSPVILQFAFGALVGLLYGDGERLSPLSACLLIGTAIGVATGADLAGLDTHHTLHPLVNGLPAAALLAGLVLVRRAEPVPAPRETRLLLALRRIGEASFVLYLIHPLVIRALHIVWAKTSIGLILPPWAMMLAGVLIMLPAALLLHAAFEARITRPLRAWVLPRLMPSSAPLAVARSLAPTHLTQRTA